MIGKLVVAILLISVIFLSGCTQSIEEEPTLTGAMIENIEEKAVTEIEKEMDKILENMTIEDIEKAIIE